MISNIRYIAVSRTFGVSSQAMRSFVSSPALLLLVACATSGPVPEPSQAPMATPLSLPRDTHAAQEYEEAKVLQLLLVDRQLYEPYTVEQSLLGSTSLRLEMARTLGRVSDSRSVRALEGLLQDPSVQVRRAAAFGLGENAPRPSLQALLDASVDVDSEVGRLAVEALAKWEAPIGQVENALVGLSEREAWSRLLPSLYRFDDARAVSLGIQALRLEGADLRRWAVFALCRNPRPEGAETIRGLLADSDPQIRGWASRGLGRVGQGDDLRLLLPLLHDIESGPTIQALRSARILIESKDLAAPDDWRSRLAELLKDPRAGVRITALEIADLWLLDPKLSTLLITSLEGQVEREKELAFLALAKGGDPVAEDWIGQLAKHSSPVLRSAAASMAFELGRRDLLDQLALDPRPQVRMAVLAEFLESDSDQDGAIRVRVAFTDEDSMVRAVALDWLREHPVVPYEPIILALREAWNDRDPDARLGAIDALQARAEKEATESDAILLALLELAEHPEFLLRRKVLSAIESLGQGGLAVGSATEQLSVADYSSLWLVTRENARLTMTTNRGKVELEIHCAIAPLTCSNFLQLAGQGFYDGLAFHRVVPDFVVQAGDPRGDGWGGPGYAIRDEINRIRYGEGVLGMALSGPHTGGSQFFITLSDQPHLDGGYTAFGQVVDGFDTLREIVQGDRILELRRIEDPSSLEGQ